MVIIPRLEYLTRITILTAKECHQIITPFRILFKYKLHMDRMTPNAILNDPLIYNFRDFYELQLQSKLKNLAVQLNQHSLMQCYPPSFETIANSRMSRSFTYRHLDYYFYT